jgi:hypothetical protein
MAIFAGAALQVAAAPGYVIRDLLRLDVLRLNFGYGENCCNPGIDDIS